MKEVRRKLNSQQGVSILFALLLLLVTAMVSTVIVSASLSSAKRTNSRKSTIQETSFLDSSALQIKNQILDVCKNDIPLNGDSESGYSIDDVGSDFNTEIKELTVAYMNHDTNYSFKEDTNHSFDIVTSYDSKENTVKVQYGYQDVGDDSGLAIFKLTSGESKMYVIFNMTSTDSKVTWTWNRASGKGVES